MNAWRTSLTSARLIAWGVVVALSVSVAAGAEYRRLPGGRFVSALALDDSAAPVMLPAFAMRSTPVTVADFLRFVQTHPAWRRDRVPSLYAASGYLQGWRTSLDPGLANVLQSPVTQVSWFAARAYCQSESARLPTWHEWEYAAASDHEQADARGKQGRSGLILQRLLERTGQTPTPVGRRAPDFYGLYDMNSLVWEWVGDYAALFVNADARNPDRQNLLQLCGGSALAFSDRSAYPLMMRVAALSAMQPADVSGNIGFRCVRDIQKETNR